MQTNRSQATRDFSVIPPPSYAIAFLVLTGGVLPFLTIAGMLWFRRMDMDGLVRFLPVVVFLVLVLGILLFAMKRRSVVLAGGVLDVRAAMYRERTQVADIDLARARVVDVTERTELRPLIKINGMSLPGFHAGRYRLRGKLVKAFCLVTDRHRVLWLPLYNGKDQLLLSVERPQALLDALHAATDGQVRRE